MSTAKTPAAAIPLYIVTGFLGSGKTTLIRNIISQNLRNGRKVGVIVNDFGDLGIDQALIPDSQGIVSTELNGGQIFCSCLSGTFIETIGSFKDLDLSMLIVEASGLAKPAPLKEIVQAASERADHRFSYSGMICVIDAARFLKLSSTLLTLEEQITYSNFFILNKIDSVDEAELQKVTCRIEEIVPQAGILKTSYGRIPEEYLQQHAATRSEFREFSMRFSGWGDTGRPVPVQLKPAGSVEPADLLQFLVRESSEFAALRIKGFIPSSDGKLFYADCVGESVSLLPAEETPLAAGALSGEDPHVERGITIIYPGSSDAPRNLFRRWKESCRTGAFIE